MRTAFREFLGSVFERTGAADAVQYSSTIWISQWLVADACFSLHTVVLR